MPVVTPEPRLPLEPEEYPLYRPPSRIGCSGLSIVTLLTLLVFGALLLKVTPGVSQKIADLPKPLLGISTDATADTTPGTGAMATQTAITTTQASPTTPPTAAPTPVIEYVKVAATGGVGVKLRSSPKSGASYNVTVGEGAVLQVVGPDVSAEGLVWRHVQLLPPDGRAGYVVTKYLAPTNKP
ncbi:MAG: hypothetical protein IVW55_09635 [Chloroflexi bacterium]|nr:hypothetical protein [Chloroflexota bacterium]